MPLLLIFSQCKEWGFLLLEMFGPTLGTGDYGHMTIEHVSMLFCNHQSLNKLSNQGFEAAHKRQRQLYTKATLHDASNSTSSCNFIVVRYYKFQPFPILIRRSIIFQKYLQCLQHNILFSDCHFMIYRY